MPTYSKAIATIVLVSKVSQVLCFFWLAFLAYAVPGKRIIFLFMIVFLIGQALYHRHLMRLTKRDVKDHD